MTKAKRGGKIARRWSRGSTRRKPAPVKISYVCPRCGGPHPLDRCRAKDE